MPRLWNTASVKTYLGGGTPTSYGFSNKPKADIMASYIDLTIAGKAKNATLKTHDRIAPWMIEWPESIIRCT